MKKLTRHIPYFALLLYLSLVFLIPTENFNYPKLLLVNIIKVPLELVNRTLYTLVYAVRAEKIIEENKYLYNQAQALKSQIAELENLKAENARLKQILSFKDKSPFSFITCRVAAKDSSSLSSTIIINGGKKHGIGEKTVAVTSSGVVGRVIEVSPGISRIMLITDPNSRINAVSSRSRCEGMLHGISGELCKLVYLPLDADIKKSDIILTSGFNSHYPKELILGSVVQVGRDPQGISLYAIVKPEFDLSRLEEVLCIK